jgi:MGT family glycosyltransferase
MARILAMPDGNWLSHVSRPFEIAKVLRRRGHEVLFASDGEYMRLPAEAGFEIHGARTLDPDHVLRCSRSGHVNWWDLAEIEAMVEDELRVLGELRPDLVIGDFRLTLSTSCERHGVPYAAVLNAAWTNYYDAPLRAPEHLAVTRLLGRALTTRLLPAVKGMIVWNDARPFRRYRRRHGLSPRGNIWDVWRGDLNLMVDTPDYGPTRDLPPSFRYVGPVFWEPDLPAPAWLDELDPERPTLYFTMGSTGYARFFELAVELFGDSRYQVIMTTAGMASFDSLPGNCWGVDYAPGSALMQRADAVVCQGGNGTIYQALTHGVPIVGIPTMHDQEFNLDRVVALGTGIHLSELRFRPEHLLAAVDDVVTDPAYRAAAAHQRDVLRTYHGPTRAADAIEELLAAA